KDAKQQRRLRQLRKLSQKLPSRNRKVHTVENAREQDARKKEPSIVMRVPESLVSLVQEMIEQHKADSE
ncbi:hypothetical protein D5E74_25615, partial [Vibrio parahaemolyticus]